MIDRTGLQDIRIESYKEALGDAYKVSAQLEGKNKQLRDRISELELLYTGAAFGEKDLRNRTEQLEAEVAKLKEHNTNLAANYAMLEHQHDCLKPLELQIPGSCQELNDLEDRNMKLLNALYDLKEITGLSEYAVDIIDKALTEARIPKLEFDESQNKLF